MYIARNKSETRVLSLILLDSQIKKNMKNLKNRIHFQFSPSQNLKKEF